MFCVMASGHLAWVIIRSSAPPAIDQRRKMARHIAPAGADRADIHIIHEQGSCHSLGARVKTPLPAGHRRQSCPRTGTPRRDFGRGAQKNPSASDVQLATCHRCRSKGAGTGSMQRRHPATSRLGLSNWWSGKAGDGTKTVLLCGEGILDCAGQQCTRRSAGVLLSSVPPSACARRAAWPMTSP